MGDEAAQLGKLFGGRLADRHVLRKAGLGLERFEVVVEAILRRGDGRRLGYRPDSHPFAHAEHVMEGRKGEAPKKLQVYNTEERIKIDGELTRRSIRFMKRQAEAGKGVGGGLACSRSRRVRCTSE